ncbi:MAG TPA: PilZ domain-containing protein [Aquificales bacterium]|nr:PilZ domain-containing protein [Aquificales bacterium]HIP86626.1 PilZ domain-containing protein [Aquifex sp.]
MELKKGGIYIAYKSDNPFKNFKFQVLETDDFFFAAQILEGIGNIELWKPYTIRLTNDLGEQKFLEIAPYYLDDKGKTAKFLVIGNLLERRKFVRFNVESYKIPVEGNQFKGIVENISLGGLKIKLLSKEGEIEEGKPIFVKGKIDGNEYNFVITPVRVGKDFIAAKFEKPAKEISEFFYKCLKLLESENTPVTERRKFRRFYVEPLNIIVDTPLGIGILYDISLGGMKVKLKRTYKVDKEILKEPFAVSCFLPSKKEEYILDCKFLNRGKDNFIQLKITRWDEEALKLISRVLELIVENQKV